MTQTHFGFETVDEAEKARRVRGVFDSVASKYDVMNDLMSLGPAPRLEGLHRGGGQRCAPGDQVLDIAGGTGDLARAFARTGRAAAARWCTPTSTRPCCASAATACSTRAWCCRPAICDAEALPFPDGSFDLVSVAFGLRNMTHKDRALAEMCRVLRPGGRLLVLEFSKVADAAAQALRLVLVQRAAADGQAGRRRRRQLPLPGRIDPHAPGPGRS